MTPSSDRDADRAARRNDGWLPEDARAELRSYRSRAVAAVSWTLLGFGLLFLFSAIAPDSRQFWDTVKQTTNAWIGIALLAVAVPIGAAALLLDHRHRGHYSPGEARPGIRHPAVLATALAASTALAALMAVVVARAG